MSQTLTPSSLVAAVLLAIFATVGAAGAPAQPAADDADSLAVPGGTVGLARTLGIDERLPRSRVLLTAIRVLWETPEGIAPAADRRREALTTYLGGLGPHRPAPAGQAADTVPSFLPPAAWLEILTNAGVGHRSTVRAILEKRQIGLLYHGAASLDPPTRAFLAARPKFLQWLSGEDRAALFATFGRALRVRDNRVQVPGGPEARPVWEAVVGESSENVEAFIERVLEKDNGRLALLYDGIAHMEQGAQRFALGLTAPAAQRARHFRSFYDACGTALGKWQPRKRPFERIPFDAVHLLLLTPMGAAGEPRGPSWAPLWKAVFDPSLKPEDARLDAPRLEKGGTVDAATLVKLVSVAGEPERRERAETWLFAQRTFADAPPASAPDLLVALRGYARYPSLLLTLDRMGVTDPATYALAVGAATRLPDADGRLWQFQAALSVIERARSARAFDAAVADRLVRSLCAVTPDYGDGHRGGVVRWLALGVLPAAADTILPAGVEARDRPLETRLLALMAGSVSSPANRAVLSLPRLEWEGVRYRVDPAGASLVRFVSVRAKQGGLSLDDVLAVARAADAFAVAPSARAAQAAAGELLPLAAQYRAVTREWTAAGPGGSSPHLDRIAQGLLDWARRQKTDPDGEKLASAVRPLQRAVDYYLADVMGSIAYAPHLGQADGPALLGGDPSRVHDFGFFTPGTEMGRRTAWELPTEWRESQAGWRVSGSLLGLDTVLGRFMLKRLAGETMPEAPKLSDAVRQAFTESACLMAALDLTDAARDAVQSAIERGRQRVAALGPGSPDVDAVALELDEWRGQAIAWAVAHEPARRFDLFSLADLARLGGLRPDVPGLDAWGPAAVSLDRGFRTVYPAHLPWSTLAGRRGVRAVPALVPDLALGLGGASARLHLPAALTAGLLAQATQEFLDTLQTAHEDDWLTLVRHAQRVAASRVEDMVAGLTINGPLVPDER